MLTKHILQNHPTFSAHGRLVDLCKPLTKVGISYFAYVHADDAAFVGFNTSPAMSEDYMKEKCHNLDIHIEGNMHLSHGDTFYTLWDTLESKTIHDIYKINSQHNISHLFTITEKQGDHVDCYHFGSAVNNTAINQFYYNNIRFLHHFIAFFKERLSLEKELNRVFDFSFPLQVHNPSNRFLLQQKKNNPRVALKSIKQSLQDNTLSIVQLELLLWLFNNKTKQDILTCMQITEDDFEHLSQKLLSFLNCKNILELRNCLNKMTFEDLFMPLLHGFSARNNKKSNPVLTGRETECLLWSAKGKTAWEISKILGISKNTVNEYLQNSAHKLNAASKTESVVKAILYQEFNMDELMIWMS